MTSIEEQLETTASTQLLIKQGPFSAIIRRCRSAVFAALIYQGSRKKQVLSDRFLHSSSSEPCFRCWVKLRSRAETGTCSCRPATCPTWQGTSLANHGEFPRLGSTFVRRYSITHDRSNPRIASYYRTSKQRSGTRMLGTLDQLVGPATLCNNVQSDATMYYRPQIRSSSGMGSSPKRAIIHLLWLRWLLGETWSDTSPWPLT